MYAIVSTDRISIPPGSVLRIPGDWQDYCQLRDNRGDGSIPRLRYRQGEILLMSPLPRHGREAHLIARIVEVILETKIVIQLVVDKYEISETSRYFLNILLQLTIDHCFTVAKEKGTGAAISKLRRSLIRP